MPVFLEIASGYHCKSRNPNSIYCLPFVQSREIPLDNHISATAEKKTLAKLEVVLASFASYYCTSYTTVSVE